MEHTWWQIKSRLVWRKGSEWNKLLEDEFSYSTHVCPQAEWISEYAFWQQYFPLNRAFETKKAS